MNGPAPVPAPDGVPPTGYVDGWERDGRAARGKRTPSTARLSGPVLLGDLMEAIASWHPDGKGRVRIRSGRVMGMRCNRYPGRPVRAAARYAGGEIAWKSKAATDGLLERAAVLSLAKLETEAGSTDYEIAVLMPRSPSMDALEAAANHIDRVSRCARGFPVWPAPGPPSPADFDELPF